MPDKDREADDAWEDVADRIARGMRMTAEERLAIREREGMQLAELLWRVLTEAGRRCEWHEIDPDASPHAPDDSLRGMRRVEGKRWVPVCDQHLEEGELESRDENGYSADTVTLDATAQGVGWDDEEYGAPL
jgi:hypothetical protein